MESDLLKAAEDMVAALESDMDSIPLQIRVEAFEFLDSLRGEVRKARSEAVKAVKGLLVSGPLPERNQTLMKQAFLGQGCGIGLAWRNSRGSVKPDRHVVFHILVDDDGSWYGDSGVGFSSFWFPEFRRVLDAAIAWVESECLPDKDDPGRRWGWRFKP